MWATSIFWKLFFAISFVFRLTLNDWFFSCNYSIFSAHNNPTYCFSCKIVVPVKYLIILAPVPSPLELLIFLVRKWVWEEAQSEHLYDLAGETQASSALLSWKEQGQHQKLKVALCCRTAFMGRSSWEIANPLYPGIWSLYHGSVLFLLILSPLVLCEASIVPSCSLLGQLSHNSDYMCGDIALYLFTLSERWYNLWL